MSRCDGLSEAMHLWVKSVSFAAASYLRQRLGDLGIKESEIDGNLITMAAREALLNNVKLNGIPSWLLMEIQRHTEEQFDK